VKENEALTVELTLRSSTSITRLDQELKNNTAQVFVFKYQVGFFEAGDVLT